jgi:hypothetical protein
MENSKENSKNLRKFMSEIERRNREMLRLFDSEERHKSHGLNLKLKTVVFRPPYWYWQRYCEKVENNGGTL